MTLVSPDSHACISHMDVQMFGLHFSGVLRPRFEYISLPVRLGRGKEGAWCSMLRNQPTFMRTALILNLHYKGPKCSTPCD